MRYDTTATVPTPDGPVDVPARITVSDSVSVDSGTALRLQKRITLITPEDVQIVTGNAFIRGEQYQPIPSSVQRRYRGPRFLNLSVELSQG